MGICTSFLHDNFISSCLLLVLPPMMLLMPKLLLLLYINIAWIIALVCIQSVRVLCANDTESKNLLLYTAFPFLYFILCMALNLTSHPLMHHQASSIVDEYSEKFKFIQLINLSYYTHINHYRRQAWKHGIESGKRSNDTTTTTNRAKATARARARAWVMRKKWCIRKSSSRLINSKVLDHIDDIAFLVHVRIFVHSAKLSIHKQTYTVTKQTYRHFAIDTHPKSISFATYFVLVLMLFSSVIRMWMHSVFFFLFCYCFWCFILENMYVSCKNDIHMKIQTNSVMITLKWHEQSKNSNWLW